MMKGQIEEQENNVQAAKDAYNQGVSRLLKIKKIGGLLLNCRIPC